MKLYSAPLSLFARKIEIALHEKALPFEREMVPFTQQAGYTPKHPAVLQANPKHQVPVLIDGDLTLFDSTLIFEYLEDAYPTPALYPTGAKLRASCRMLELFADDIVLPPLRSLMHRTEPPHTYPRQREANEHAARQAEATLRDLYAELEHRLGHQPYFCGELSVADIAIFMSILFSLRLRGPALDATPALAAWYRRTGTRPAFATAAAEIAAADRQLSPKVPA